MYTEVIMTSQPAITVSRSLGSGGSLIGYHLAQRLGWRYLDRRILRRAAAGLGMEVEDLDRQEERPDSFLERLLLMLGAASPEVPYTPPAEVPLYGEEIFAEERRIMEQALAQAPAVLVGRGGFVAFKDRPSTFHVHVRAATEFRIQRLLEIGKAGSVRAAEKLIRQSDQDRAAFIKEISGLDWQDPRNFHLVVDPSRDGFPACENYILEARRLRFGA
jgi:cytidylate kinase